MSSNYLNKRVFKLNVGFLLSEGPGNAHVSEMEIPEPVSVGEDLILQYVSGTLRLSRTKEGILVQAQLRVGMDNECSRCLDSVVQDIDLQIEELFAFQNPNISEFNIAKSGVMDLAPLIRAEAFMGSAGLVLCREDCKGLCITCGTNLNNETCDCEIDDINPQFAALKKLLDE